MARVLSIQQGSVWRKKHTQQTNEIQIKTCIILRTWVLFKLASIGSYINGVYCEMRLPSFLITLLIIVLKKRNLCWWALVGYCTVCQPHHTLLYMVNLHKQSDMLHNYGCIDSTVLRSYNTACVLASFCYFFVSHMMYCQYQI